MGLQEKAQLQREVAEAPSDLERRQQQAHHVHEANTLKAKIQALERELSTNQVTPQQELPGREKMSGLGNAASQLQEP